MKQALIALMVVLSLMFGGQKIVPFNQAAWASATEGILNLATGGLFDLMDGGFRQIKYQSGHLNPVQFAICQMLFAIGYLPSANLI